MMRKTKKEMMTKRTEMMIKERKELRPQGRKLNKKARLKKLGRLSKLRLLQATLLLFLGFLKAQTKLPPKGASNDFAHTMRALGYSSHGESP